MTAAEYSQKWDVRFRDNDVFLVSPADLREFKNDTLAVFGLQGVNVPLYSPTKTYDPDYLVRWTVAGQKEAFYYSLQAGKLPAPTGATDANWKVVPGPVGAAVLSQELTLLQAQGMEGSQVVPGRTYLVDFGPDAAGNAQVVTLLGTAANLFAIRGQLTVAGARSNVRVNVASGVFGVEPFDLLKTANIWLEVQDFTKGIKLPAGAKVDEGGSAFFQRLDVGQRHYTFGLYHSLGKDGIIQWKPTEFINQDGDGDVGLARAEAGVLEVNDGRPNYLAILRTLDVEAMGAPYDYNSLVKLALAMQNIAHVPGAQVLWVEGGLQSYQPARGVRARPFPTLEAAQQAAFDGDTIVVRLGGTGRDVYGRPYYMESFLWEKNVTIVFEPGAVYGGLFQCARFIGLASFTRRTLIGGEFLGRVLLWRQSATDCDMLVLGARFTGIGFFEVNGGGSYNNAFLTKAVLRNCSFDSSLAANDLGPVRLIGRDDMGPAELELDNTPVSSPAAPCLSFQANEASRLTLRGAATELRGPNKAQTLPTSPSGYQIPEATWINDKRPAGAVGAGASSFGQLTGAPRDNAALAGELNAVLALSDGRRNLITTSASRYNDLVLESAVTLSNLRRGPNAAAITGQLLQNGTTAVSAPRQGADADVLAALNADIAALADPSFYIIRFQTAVAVSTDVAHVLLTVSR